ncbi:MAG: methionine--tRNA ligase [SAR202 cluster bacterium]|nr:methionine--tRNA ligase [SAR202 cluster bacterium]
MSERILVAVAWPYANGSIHVGQVAGAYIPADIFARYHRMAGNDVLMVSGSDSHGTPVTLEAEKRGVPAEEVFGAYHSEFVEGWQGLGISFDLFTSTHTDNHFTVAQEIFLKLKENGYIFIDTMLQPFCETDNRFLADRYVDGKCPHCGLDGARGDQCDNCGRTLDPHELVEMKCKLCGNEPIIRETEHFFVKLSAFESQLLDWVRSHGEWKPNVRNFSIGYLEGGLHDRAITRDIEWGVPLPLDGYDGKRLYVWFEAVIGYLSASKQWAKEIGQPDRWKEFWEGKSKSYYFMGKDNIPFHTVIWPAMLMGHGDLNLPYNVPANEFLNYDGKQFSTSRNWAVWLPDYLDRYEPDPLRYVLAATMPETSDSDFSWGEYLRRNNDELVATYGNLVHRVMTMSYRNFDGKVPQPGELDFAAQALLVEAAERLDEAGRNVEECRFRAGLETAMTLARSCNVYLDQKAPWKALKTDREDAATTLWVGLSVINCLKTALNPYLPFSSEKLHKMLGFEGNAPDQGWTWDRDRMRPGQVLGEPKPLFVKLDDDIVQKEAERIGT